MGNCCGLPQAGYLLALPSTDASSDAAKARAADIKKRAKKYAWMKETDGPKLPARVDDVPLAEQFSPGFVVSFASDLIQGKVNAIVAKLNDACEEFEDYDDLYRTLPRPACYARSFLDKEFAGQRLYGYHAVQIALCKQLPKDCEVTDKDVAHLLSPKAKTLKALIKQKRLFVCDWRDLLRDVTHLPQCTIAVCFALFYLYEHDNGETEFLPLAIQFEHGSYPKTKGRRPAASGSASGSAEESASGTASSDASMSQSEGDRVSVFTPVEREFDYYADKSWRKDPRHLTWFYARLHAQMADSHVHQFRSHLLRTHLYMETAYVALNRKMHPTHPVYELLKPHFMYTLAINAAAFGTLVAKAGIVDRLTAAGQAGALEISSRAFQSEKLYQMEFLTDLEERGVADPDVLPGIYPYREDGMLVSEAVRNFVTEVIDGYYEDDAAVAGDVELVEWYKEMRAKELEMKFKKIETKKHAIDLISHIVFVSSASHAAMNFSQYDFMGYPLNVPGQIYDHPPTSLEYIKSEKQLLSTLVTKKIAAEGIAVVKTLSELSPSKLGQVEADTGYQVPEGPIKVAVGKFKTKLAEITRKINTANASREIPYNYLNPDQIPNSIAI